MMVVDLDQQGPAISLAELDAFEARLGRHLPAGYRAFLTGHNGGEPQEHVLSETPQGDLAVQLFFGIWAREFFDIDAENQKMQGRFCFRWLNRTTVGSTFGITRKRPKRTKSRRS